MIYYCIATICSSLVNDMERAGVQIAGEENFLGYLSQNYPGAYWVKSIASLGVFAFVAIAPFFADKWWHPIFLFIASFMLSCFIVRPLVALIPWKNIVTPIKIFGWIAFLAGSASWGLLFIK